MPQQTLLVIDDSPDVHALLRARLKPEALLVHVASGGEQGLQMARELRPDIILLDVDMPGLTGFEVCRHLKGHADTASIPVIFLTGTTESFVKVEAFDLGAVDYITKPFDPAELRARVRAALRTKRYQDLLALRAEIDGLTGLANRAHFDRQLSERVDAARRGGGPVGLVMLDIDHFKAVNDKFGHPFGDRVIQRTGEVLAASVRAGDMAFRYGGEEFAVLAANATLSGAAIAAGRISAKLASSSCEHGGQRLPVTVSCGVSSTELFPLLHDGSGAQLVAAADRALYAAKGAGRNRICIAGQQPAGSRAPSCAPAAEPPRGALRSA